MRKTTYLYGITDDKYVRSTPGTTLLRYGIDTYKFKTPEYFKKPPKIDYNDVSIVFKASPDTLLNLAAQAVDALPFPNVYDWSIEDICRWLRKSGYPQYQNTFRENLINGHTLLLLDAAALSAMNIKNFNHIQNIAYGIRKLYEFHITKFGRSISLPPEFPYELYKMFRVKTGRIYDTTKCSSLLRRMQVIREQQKYFDHWDALCHNLRRQRYPKYRELFGAYHRNVYHYYSPPISEKSIRISSSCKCVSPCKCFWKTAETRSNMRLSGSTFLKKNTPKKTRLDLLEKLYPHKYGTYLYEIFEFDVQTQVVKFHTRKSSNSLHAEQI